ncbi:hypothetical protein LCGC14_2599910, partial [marine sediment metagenome]
KDKEKKHTPMDIEREGMKKLEDVKPSAPMLRD